METSIEIIARVARLLEEMPAAYAVVGSIASSLYGNSRSTADVDFLADLRQEHASRFVSALEKDFYVDARAVLRAIAARRMFNAIHSDSLFEVDVYVAPADEFTREQLRRRRLETLFPGSSQAVYLVSPEDTLLAKLRWHRLGGGVSARQLSDAIGILKVQGDQIDVAYLREWADKLGVSDLLEQVLGGARA